MTLAKPPQSATVKLTSFCLYRVNGKPGAPNVEANIEVIAGASSARYGDNGKIQLLATSVPFHSESFNSRAPKRGDGILALYGHRDALEELHYWRERARSLKAEFAYVDFEVWVSEISPQLVTRSLLKESGELYRFLNIRRTQAGLQSEILENFQNYIQDEGGRPSSDMARVSQIALRPDLFGRLLSEDDEMKHVTVFVTPIADDDTANGKMRQVAYVRPNVTILNAVQGADNYEILMPSWMNVRTTVAA